MAKKRKISIRKILRAFVTLVVTAGCVVAVLGASRMQRTKVLNKIRLNVRNEHKYQFLDKQALWNDLIEEKGIKEGVTRLSGLDIRSMERQAYRNPWISAAQVYVDNNRDMHISVTQRVPVARIFFENGQSYYLDASLRLLPLSELFTYYTTIVTNVPVLENDSLNKNLRAQIVSMVKFVERDTFWSAQIAQISVTPDRKFELIPVLGTHRIMFGDTSQMSAKFRNLFAFYTHVLNRIGWDKYEVLDLRFKDQVIAMPSLPWKPPTKNAISNMDWVKSIMGDTPKDTAKTFIKTQAQAAVTANSKPAVQISTPKKSVVTKEQPKKPVPGKEQLKRSVTTKEQPKKPAKETKTQVQTKGKYIYQGNENN